MSELRLDGNMDFARVACGELACPFYLGDADIVQADGNWRIALDPGSSPAHRHCALADRFRLPHHRGSRAS